MNIEIMKKIVWKEDYITIAKNPRLENSQSRNWKNKQNYEHISQRKISLN